MGDRGIMFTRRIELKDLNKGELSDALDADDGLHITCSAFLSSLVVFMSYNVLFLYFYF